jgi:LysM repeat protein
MRPILTSTLSVVAAVAATSCSQVILAPSFQRGERVLFDAGPAPRSESGVRFDARPAPHGIASVPRGKASERRFGASVPRGVASVPRAQANALRGDPYVVRRGDVLSSIAARLGTSVEALVRVNGLADPNRLEVGQRLRVPPGANRTVAKPTKPRPAVSSPPPQSSSARRVAATPATAPRGAETVPATGPRNSLFAVDRAIRDTAQRLRSAHFEETLDEARKARSLLTPLQSEPGAAERSARVEVLAAMAEIALGRDESARASFERALLADPGLTLAPGEVSPKILRLFEETRKQVALRQASR